LLWLRWIEIRLAESVIKKTPAKLMPSEARIKVDDEIVLIGEIGSNRLNRPNWNERAVHIYGTRLIMLRAAILVLGGRDRKLAQDVGDGAVLRPSFHRRETVCSG